MVSEKRIKEIRKNIGKAGLEAKKEVEESMKRIKELRDEAERKLRKNLRL